MIECPEFDYDYQKSHAIYLWCLRVASIANLCINPPVMYSIIYHSSAHMNTYRWYLLIHQIIAFLADIWLNFFTQGVILVPFPAGYTLGYSKNFMSSPKIFALAQGIVVCEQMTVILLFFYRYQAVHRLQTISIKWKCFLFFLFVLTCASLCSPLTLSDNTDEILDQLAENYTCITRRLRRIDSIAAFSKMEIITKSLLLIMFSSIFFIISAAFLVNGSWRATCARRMSSHLRHMQQRFIFQLCLQSFIPFCVVIGPILSIVGIIIFDVFGFSWLSDIVLGTCSMFSVISAVTLFIMNPSYHHWFTRRFTDKKTKLHRISSVQSRL